MAGRMLRWAPALGLAALWWWAVFRLALAPDAGVLEGAVAAGGWGLSLLPVHCVPKGRAVGAGRRGRVRGGGGGGDVGGGGGGGPWQGWVPEVGSGFGSGNGSGAKVGVESGSASGAGARSLRAWVTKAWRRRRSGGGSGPS
ncbi:hypothetical protein GCM10012286_12100 [Streptomyces lasiicapitis]|uniref:Uncharacterized protein n=1 Tax=Streptomyces lasiicapitis TaxID=1923961 RepID=A0ABQ2LK96_9ACTN|nr:hypothetical protein GCM10012286_12100 [Streptomyces lasiicapitis]